MRGGWQQPASPQVVACAHILCDLRRLPAPTNAVLPVICCVRYHLHSFHRERFFLDCCSPRSGVHKRASVRKGCRVRSSAQPRAL